MNSTTTNKVTKKKLKIKEKFNNCYDIESAESAVGHSLQKQQQEEKVKKKFKKKKIHDNDTAESAVSEGKIVKNKFKHEQICGIDAAGAVNNHLVQKAKIVKKKLKKKQNSDIVDTSGAAIGQQQNHNKFIKHVKQTCNNSTDFETTGVVIGHSLQKPEQQQADDEKCLEKYPRVKQSSKSSDIKTVDTVFSHALQQQQPDIEYYHKQAYIFMKTLKRDYKRLTLVYNGCIKAEQERERRNVEEIDQLKRIYNHMQAERTDIKRKRWCRYCESEATYLSSAGTNFYCSQECELKQNDLVSAMEETFES